MIRLSPAGGGPPLPLIVPSVPSRYVLRGHAGVSILQVAIHEPGRYRLEAHYPAGRSGPPVVLAIGRDTVGALLLLRVAAVAIGLAGACAGVALAIWTLLGRPDPIRELAAQGRPLLLDVERAGGVRPGVARACPRDQACRDLLRTPAQAPAQGAALAGGAPTKRR